MGCSHHTCKRGASTFRFIVARIHQTLVAALVILPWCQTVSSVHAQPFIDATASFGLPAASSIPALTQLGAGIVAADMDSDGYVDLLVSGAGGRLAAWRGTSSGFVAWAGLLPGGRQLAVEGFSLFDADQDGDLDLWVAAQPRSRLFLFDNKVFRDVTTTHLPAIFGADASATPVDLDGDGDLDLLVARYILTPSFPFHRCSTNLYLANDGHGRFSDRTEKIGLGEREGCSFMAAVHDVDGDSLVDIVVVNDFAQFLGGQEIWLQTGRNAEGDPLFTESAAALGFDAPVYGMGLALGDPDLDGRTDWVVTNIGEPSSWTWDAGTGRFMRTPTAWRTGLRFAEEAALATWVSVFEDLDGDGREDLVFAASRLGAAYFLDNREPQESPVLMAGSDGWRELPRGDGPGPARDFAVADLDGDGIPELATVRRNGDVHIWKNIGRPHAATTVRLQPTQSASAAGAVVRLECRGVSRSRHVIGGQHFGQLAAHEVRLDLPAPCAGPDHAAEVSVQWPGGAVSRHAVTTGAVHEVVEPELWSLSGDLRTVRLHRAAIEQAGLSVAEMIVSAHGAELSEVPENMSNGDVVFAYVVHAGRDDSLPWFGLGRVGQGPFAIKRLPADSEGLRASLWLGAAKVVAGQVVSSFVHLPADVTEFGGLQLVDSADGTTTPITSIPANGGHRFEFVAPRAGRFELQVTGCLRCAWPLEVEPFFDAGLSEIAARDHVVLASAAPAAEVRVRTLLRDANGARVGATAADLTLLVHGVHVAPDRVHAEGQWLTMFIQQQRLRDGDQLSVLAFGLPVAGTVRFRRLTGVAALGTALDRTASSCVLSEPSFSVDSRERGVLVARFVDAEGHPLPDTLVTPRWSGGHGVEIVSGTEVISNGYATVKVAGDAMRVTPGPELPAVSPGDGIDGVVCVARVFASEPRFPVDATESIMRRASSSAADGALEIDVPARFHVIPRSRSGRATGFERGLSVGVGQGCEGQTVSLPPPVYVGGGGHEFFVTPRAGEAVCLGVLLDGQLLRTFRFDVAATMHAGLDGGPISGAGDALDDISAAQADDSEFAVDHVHVDAAGGDGLTTDAGADLGRTEPPDMAASGRDVDDEAVMESVADNEAMTESVAEPYRNSNDQGCGSGALAGAWPTLVGVMLVRRRRPSRP